MVEVTAGIVVAALLGAWVWVLARRVGELRSRANHDALTHQRYIMALIARIEQLEELSHRPDGRLP